MQKACNRKATVILKKESLSWLGEIVDGSMKEVVFERRSGGGTEF